MFHPLPLGGDFGKRFQRARRIAGRRVVHDMNRGNAGPTGIILGAYIHRHWEELRRWQRARRRRADRVVIRDHGGRFDGGGM
jgi:hypothetical protein